MKIKVSVSMEEDTIKAVEELIRDGRFRNKSHFIEFATKQRLIKEDSAR
ncbi:ribbon-helix-helix domain-containing protein [Candidatus Woesearchaeota archaeon]|nr:ribbon-helix-helix domain-containing protein [Candidatus Woesearchaeota archaeon]